MWPLLTAVALIVGVFLSLAPSASAAIASDRSILEMPSPFAGSTAFWSGPTGDIKSRQTTVPGATAPSWAGGGSVHVDPKPYTTNSCGGQASGGVTGNGVSVGDVNGDGLGDLVMGCLLDDKKGSNAGSVVVYVRDAANTGFNAAIELFAPAPAANEECGAGVTLADVNNDGLADVVMGCPGASGGGEVVAFQSNGGNPAAFDAGATIAPGGSGCGNSLAATDMNADGFIDIAIGCDSGSSRVVTSDGGPGGAAVTYSAAVVLTTARTGCARGIAAGDINGDGFGDVAVTCTAWSAGNQWVQMFMSNGGSPVTFQAMKEYAPTSPVAQDTCSAVSIGDLNDDGLADVALGCNQSTVTQGNGRIAVFKSNGGTPAATTLAAPVMLTQTVNIVQNCGYSVVIVDVDGDGLNDVAAGCSRSNASGAAGKMVHWRSNGGASITFQAQGADLVDPVPTTGDNCGLSAAAGDIDGDGMADLVIGCPGDDTAATNAGNIVSFINTTSVAFGASQVLTSKKLNRTAMTVDKATLNADVRLNGQTVSWQMSANGGTNWAAVTPGVQHTFAVTGTDLRARATLTSAANQTALIHDLSVSYSAGVVPNVAPSAVQQTPLDAGWIGSIQPFYARYYDTNFDTGKLQFEFCNTNAASPWSSNCGASYQYVETAAGLNHLDTASVTPPTSLTSGTWYWRVRATDLPGLSSAYTAARSVGVDLTAPTPPTGLVITPTGTTSVDLDWTTSTDAGVGGIMYDVQESPDGTSWADTAGCSAISVVTCSAAGLPTSAVVHMRVRPCDELGNCGAWQSVVGTTATGPYNLRTGTNYSSYFTNTANRIATLASGTMNITTTVTHANTVAPRWYPIRPGVSGSTTTVGATEPADTIYTAPTGTGWAIDATAGKTISAGAVSATIRTDDTSATGVGNLQCRLYRATLTAGSITASTFLGKQTIATDVLTTTIGNRSCTPYTIPAPLTLAANEVLYFELWLNVTTAGAAGASFWLETEGASSFVTLPQMGVAPNAPTQTSPANAASTGANPTLSAVYTHPTPSNGYLEFEVATTAGFGGTVVQTGTTASLAHNATGSLVTSGLANGTTYHWRVRGISAVDGTPSIWSSTWTFTPSATSISLLLDFTTVNMGMQTANIDDYASFTATVTTTNASGYNLTALGNATGTGTNCSSCLTPFDDWTGTSANPSPWVATTSGPNGYAGITVRDALGGRDSLRWGAGTATTESSAANDYAGLGDVSPVLLHNRATAAGAGDPVIVTWRLTPSTTTSSATHSEIITVTATVNP
ncbi:MAG: hypothetical protein JWM90_998 [Thermoleophilia bacterium]|nr:hypothetical protein [Thermoleophilia bacterium]